MALMIQARGLRYTYEDGIEALRGVDFDLEAGETVALLGANGSGKTTFALHLNGLLSGGGGSIEVAGLPVEKRHYPAIRQKIGFVFQDADEQLFLPTVLEDVAFGPLNLGLPPQQAEQRAREALEAVGTAALGDRAPYHLSAGEKRRVALAGVLAMQPDILVLDEPTTFLDPPGWRDLVRLLRGLPQAKLLITHDLAFARALATRAVFFEKGRIAGEGSVADVARQFGWDVA